MIDGYVRSWLPSSFGSNLKCPEAHESSTEAMKPGRELEIYEEASLGGAISPSRLKVAEPSDS